MTKQTDNPELPVVKVHVTEQGTRPRKGWTECYIGEHLQFSADTLASYFFAKWEPVVFDALLLAAAIEFCDKSKKRPKFGWGREINLRLPVHDPEWWSKKNVSSALKQTLEFLTGDCWHIEFSKRNKAEAPPRQGLFELPMAGSVAVIPFSEGLDSRAVSALMTKQYGNGVIRVRLGKKAHDRPIDNAGHPLPFTTVPYKVRANQSNESSARSRGFKFALLSAIAAYLANAQKIIIPESGQGALGPTLVTVGQSYDDFRNHPAFTAQMEEFLNAVLGTSLKFEFPRLWFTKGQTLKEYIDLGGSEDWATTRSCWQDNRHVSIEGKRRQCGICAACMLRRLSIHAAGKSEATGTYVWDNLSAPTFEAGAAKGLRKIEKTQREYAIAGTLHLDHLAGLKDSPAYAFGLKTSARLISRAMKVSPSDVEENLSTLLGQHKKEWNAFMSSLGPSSFVQQWTERQQ